jgi:hypothetical protein
MAWSPDGATLAVATSNHCGHTSHGYGVQLTLTAFVDMTTGRPLTPQPPMRCLAPLGWRSATTLVGEEIRADGGYGLAEASLRGSGQTPMSHFSDRVWGVQLATNLLSTAGVRTGSEPDRGPWVPIVHIGIQVLAVLLIGSALLLLLALVRRRSHGSKGPVPLRRQH